VRIPGLELQVDTGDVAWRETRTPGVRWLLLGPRKAGGEGTQREATVLIRMDPGHGYPAHEHLDVEEVLILAGGYRDEQGEHGCGSYLRYEAGSAHAPVALGDAGRPADATNPACVLFAVARGGIRALAPDETLEARERR
jgi:anti-sigma factor ChrR (cupin superfamily)